ncbi:4Fe-4S single cluster domain-containing protein [Streptomyces sp. DH10]|uniref:4Fe-4S single cluster domain-containing protein n=1 Tax=Streptomyces sp. DH10 TaxID=3040121 RepID=UPI002440F3DE|nr:4Fe-4S single cluster domain-containing protein [Streptomyces sp. DH10]MDG9710480.1 4Fe-4S single cluster domain-containing protein [Streptomyces sp. DH10]
MTGHDLNVAATRVGTHALGPGRRSVVWVQGCPFRCAGCLAPDWIPNRAARHVAPAQLADELLADPDVTGLTLSGGEPMAQAAGLVALVRAARARRDLTVICFTGYRLERLRARPPAPEVPELLGLLDVLIDGQYVTGLDDGKGLRGSSNQRVHHLTPRLATCEHDFTGGPRTSEITLEGNTALLVGVPPPGLLAAFDSAVKGARSGLRLPDIPDATPPAARARIAANRPGEDN